MSHHHTRGEEHGHAHDRGLFGLTRYLSQLPYMWRSPVSDAVVELVRPRPGERVVDLGAGMGPATVVAARTGAHVVAVDPTPFMRHILKARVLTSRNRALITVLDGAAESLPLDTESVDALWTVNTVHHWTSVPSAAAELRRVLRPGGRVVLLDEDFEDQTHPFYERLHARHATHAHHFAEVDPKAVAAVFHQHGFSEVAGSLERVAGRPVKLIRATAPGPKRAKP